MLPETGYDERHAVELRRAAVDSVVGGRDAGAGAVVGRELHERLAAVQPERSSAERPMALVTGACVSIQTVQVCVALTLPAASTARYWHTWAPSPEPSDAP